RRRALARGRNREAGAKDRGEAEPWIELQRDEQNGADDDEEAADRERRVEVLLELRVDGKRQRLRHPLQAAGEDDRRAELAEPAGERERGRRGKPARCQRERHARKYPSRRRAERARGVEQRRIDALERRDRAADVERALDERDGEHDRGLRER